MVAVGCELWGYMKMRPNFKRRINGASVYRCASCGTYGCMKGMLMGYLGPYSGCWTKKPCPNCGRSDTKKHVGTISG